MKCIPPARPPTVEGRAALHVDVAGLPVDAVTVEVLARLCLAARRYGRRIVLDGVDDDLRALVTFMGLADVLL